VSNPKKSAPREAALSSLFSEFTGFAKDWPNQHDLKRLAFSFAPNGFLLVGNPEIPTLLIHAAIDPTTLQKRADWRELFFTAFARSPDFILGLITQLRRVLSRGLVRKLFAKSTIDGKPLNEMSDAEITWEFSKAIGQERVKNPSVKEGAVKVERNAARKTYGESVRDREEASTWLKKKWASDEKAEPVEIQRHRQRKRKR
jgi:hypothetical protein